MDEYRYTVLKWRFDGEEIIGEFDDLLEAKACADYYGGVVADNETQEWV